jgi:DNA-binding transcriptional regulator YbjK
MPPNLVRRNQILDAAIDILTDVGIGGVTHRQIDERAGLPAGTTSNYFRTRLALLEATAGRVAELHWQYVALLQSGIGEPLSRDTVEALLTRMVTDPDEPARRRQIARFELFLEGTRRTELLPFLDEMQSAALKSAELILESAGLQPSPHKVGEISRLLNGLAFSNITFTKDQPGAEDPAGLIGRILAAVFDGA